MYAFRGTTETEKTHSFQLSGLLPGGKYRLKFYDHSSPDRTVTGRELMREGLKAALALQNRSELVFIDKEAH